MRRPLCLFCAGALGVELVCAFLPQAWLLPLLAAIFVSGLLFALLRWKTARAGALCLLLGSLLGLALTVHTDAKLQALETAYEGKTATLTAEVERTDSSYYPGVVDAVLRVEQVDGEAADFRIRCAALPKCQAGERVRGKFTLEAPPETDRLDLYADGVPLTGELLRDEMLERLGESSSFRARTARLQRRLSGALRRGMAHDPAGVLAAMVVGDRSHLSSALRTAYRGAGLSHVLVVSGMHVSILCGSFLEHLPTAGRRRKLLRRYAHRRAKALLGAGMAVLMVGVTGSTPSVLRAGVAVWVSAVGIWGCGPADALTSLGVAGVWMTLGNSYAVCDMGFELSFAAVVGTLAGAELARRSQEARIRAEKTRKTKNVAHKRGGVYHNILQRGKRLGGSVWETLCVSGCACAAHLPGAGGPGVERQPLRPCFQRGGALARGADPAAGPWNGPAGAGPCAGSAPPSDLPLRRISC